MRVNLKTAGLLGRFLPPGSDANAAVLDVPEGATPVDVMKQLGMPLEGSYLVSLNGAVVPRTERARRPLAENDNLVIMPPLKGG